MAKAPRPWIVTPHSPLVKHEENLWAVESPVPGIPAMRRMTIARRKDGSLVFFHAVPLDEPSLAEVLAFGKPAALVISHAQHGIDADAFAEKLGIGIYGPKASEARMRKRFRNFRGLIDELAGDSSVSFESMDGTKSGEPVQIVRSNGRVTLAFTDVYQEHVSPGFFMKIAGFGGGPKVTPVFKMLFVKDKLSLRAHLERLASTPGLACISPCHGPIVSQDPAGTIRRVAASL